MFDSVRCHGQQPTRLLCPQDSPGKNTGVGCHFLSGWLHNKTTHLAQGYVFPLILYQWLYNNNVSCLRTCFSFLRPFWLILSSWNVSYGSESGKTFTTLRHSFDLLLITNWKAYSSLAKTSEWGSLCPPSDVYVRSFLCPFFALIKLCYTRVLEWSSLAPGPKVNSSEIMNLTPFIVLLL